MRCPFCKEETFPKKKLITDGWKVVGEIEVCALCGAELEKAGEQKSRENSSSSKDRLAALLGSEPEEKIVLAADEDCKFCRHCRHFLVHPFKTVCAISDRETDPMGECALFEKRSVPDNRR